MAEVVAVDRQKLDDIVDAVNDRSGTTGPMTLGSVPEAVRSIKGSDIGLGITGASVGDLLKIAAVDDKGTPTEYQHTTLEELDEPMEHLITLNTERNAVVKIDKDKNGTAFNLKSVLVKIRAEGDFVPFIFVASVRLNGVIGELRAKRVDPNLKDSWFVFRVDREHGVYKTNSTSAKYSNETGPVYGDAYKRSTVSYLNNPIISVWTIDEFPANSTIEVYGVRA